MWLYLLSMLRSFLLVSPNYLMENVFGKGRPKRYIFSWWVRWVGVWVALWCLNNNLFSTEERSKVRVKVLLLLAGLAAWGWPKIYRICSCFNIYKAWAAHCNEDHREEDNRTWISHTESPPWRKCHPQAILKPFTKPFTTGNVSCKSKKNSKYLRSQLSSIFLESTQKDKILLFVGSTRSYVSTDSQILGPIPDWGQGAEYSLYLCCPL